MVINGIITAAGLSSRMGDFKPLLKLKDKTMIECSVDSMLNAGVDQAVVVLGYRAKEVGKLLRERYDPTRVLCADNPFYAETDMMASVKTGISALPPCDAFYLLPGDMPAVRKDTFDALKETMAGTKAAVVFPTFEGHREHPPLISWDLRELILGFHGEGGLKTVWEQLEDRILEVPVEDRGCRMDADTREDYDHLVSYIAQAF